MSIEPLPFHVETVGPFAGIGVVRLEQPGKPVVVLDHPLIQRLEATLAAMSKDLRGLVVASGSPRVFVAGADLKTISEWKDEQLHAYLAYGSRVFGMISALPCPTAAAINGAVLGGGLELAMHCDGLIASPPAMKDGQPGKPYPVGLPEAGLGLCPGWGGTNLLPARMDPARAITITATGAPMTFDEARDAGLFDAVAESHDALLSTAMTWIESVSGTRWQRDGAPSRWIGRGTTAPRVSDASTRVRLEITATEPTAAVLDAVDAGITKGWHAALEVEQRHLVRLRHTPGAKAALAAFFEKSAKK
jgi:enoyl-CoA hydratase